MFAPFGSAEQFTDSIYPEQKFYEFRYVTAQLMQVNEYETFDSRRDLTPVDT